MTRDYFFSFLITDISFPSLVRYVDTGAGSLARGSNRFFPSSWLRFDRRDQPFPFFPPAVSVALSVLLHEENVITYLRVATWPPSFLDR